MELKKIHSDVRGNLYTLKFGDREFLLMETKKNHRRGGDLHNSVQHDVVLHGKAEFHFMEEEIIRQKVLSQGEVITFPAKQPHMLTALADCLVLEWLEGPFEKTYYEPFRRLCK